MVAASEVVRAWGKIAAGRTPALSLEITRECPLRCPGCYAYEDAHLGDGRRLRELADLNGDRLVERVLALVDEIRPLHVSLVGGDPLVRYRELGVLLPQLVARGVFVQVVTSAFRPLPLEWAALSRCELVVSIDGLREDHDARRQPATYERILRHIQGHQIVVHCTITAPMADHPGYLGEFVAFWSANPWVKKIWTSIFTPQRGAELREIPSPEQRALIIDELDRLRAVSPKLDLRAGTIAALRHPPASPADCIFAQTTRCLSADLKTRIAPCQFGGDPDCSRCGCMASMALTAIGDHKLPLGIPVGALFRASHALGQRLAARRAARMAAS